MTKYYCRGNVCKTKREGRQVCCYECLNSAWCSDMGEWTGCVPWMCGKSIKVTDRYFRCYAKHGAGRTFLVRKCKQRKLEGKN